MLFRHSLPTPARFLKFNVYTPTTRAFKTNGARANDSSHLHGPETASTPPDAATAERKPDEIPLFAHVGKAEVQSMDNLRITSRQSGRALIHEESLRWKLKKGHDAAIERATNLSSIMIPNLLGNLPVSSFSRTTSFVRWHYRLSKKFFRSSRHKHTGYLQLRLDALCDA